MQVKIGPIRYDVVETEINTHTCGETDVMKCRIRINAGMHPDIAKVTLWHEIIHGILFAAGLTDHDEQVTDAIAHGIVQVLADNPELKA
jgi:hypothetical protein